MVLCMPILNFRFQGKTTKGDSVPGQVGLQTLGPRVPVQVALHPSAVKAASEKNQTILAPVPGWGLIDTGASITSLDRQVAHDLGLAPTGTMKLGTAGGPTDAPTYAFAVTIAGGTSVNCARGVGCDLSGQGIILLLGMDALSSCILIVNGPDGMVSLAI